MKRYPFSLALMLFAALHGLLPAQALAKARKDTAVLGMVLEPSPGLDPTSASAASIGEIVHYNVFEGLTKINMDGSVTPLLAQRWDIDPDGKSYTFHLRQGVKFHDGQPFTSADVKFSFERAKAPGSTNKAKKAVFDNISRIDTPDPLTVIAVLNRPDGNFLFRMGENTAVILNAASAATAATKPVGTGPYRFDSWAKGASITLVKDEGYRFAPAVKLKKVTFRFISDPAAQVAALLAGDIDGMPRFGAIQSLKQFEYDPRYTVVAGGTEGKTILSINNKKKPFDDVRVRRALAAAIDRKAVIDGSSEGYGKPIGSHMVPSDAGYIDLTGVNPYNPERARALLKEAGVATPLNVTLTLPPPDYARKGGEIVAAELAEVGINAKIENVEWSDWLKNVYTNKNYDLTIISHVEPLDIGIYAKPGYYFNYDNADFNAIIARLNSAPDLESYKKALVDAQKKIADDAVNAFLFQLPNVTIADAKLQGVWKNAPIFAIDIGALSWK